MHFGGEFRDDQGRSIASIQDSIVHSNNLQQLLLSVHRKLDTTGAARPAPQDKALYEFTFEKHYQPRDTSIFPINDLRRIAEYRLVLKQSLGPQPPFPGPTPYLLPRSDGAFKVIGVFPDDNVRTLLDTRFRDNVWDEIPLKRTDVRAVYFGFERVFQQWSNYPTFTQMLNAK
jgi:hypothetical protein